MRGVVAVLAGCTIGVACVSDSSNNPSDSGTDATTGDVVTETSVKDVATEAAVDAGACDLTKPFGQPKLLTNVDTGESEEAFWPAPDQLSAFLSASRNPNDGGFAGYHIFTTSRPSLTADFAPIVPLTPPSSGTPINVAGLQRSPIVSADGLTLIYNVFGTNYDIDVAVRASTLVPFQDPQPLAGVNGTTNDTPSYLSPDALHLLLYSDRSGKGGFGIYEATRSSTTTSFGTPTLVNIQTDESAFSDTQGVMTPDELTIYFASTRAPSQGVDVWTASRGLKSDGFGTATLVTELSTALNDWPTWISPDGCTMYMMRQQADGGCCVYDVLVASK